MGEIAELAAGNRLAEFRKAGFGAPSTSVASGS